MARPTLIILDFKVSNKHHLIRVLISNTVFEIYYFENSMLPFRNNDYLVILLVKEQITNVGIRKHMWQFKKIKIRLMGPTYFYAEKKINLITLCTS